MKNRIKTFYTEKQVCFDNISKETSCQPQLKPYFLLKRFQETGYAKLLEIESKFDPISKENLAIAHTEEYINNVYFGKGNYRSNSLPWTKNLVESLTYATGSLYAASKWAIENPEQITLAPVSGINHSKPSQGRLFSTFSGQVISAVKIYQETGKVCAYIDLDGYFGNSIEDTREFNPLLDKAIPTGCNINPIHTNAAYVSSLMEELGKLGVKILNGEVDYVVFAHGANSHFDDDLVFEPINFSNPEDHLGGQCGTEYWMMCAEKFAHWVSEISILLGRKLPVVLVLFGGERVNELNTVLDLHIKSILTCSNIIYNQDIKDNLIIEHKPN